MHGAPQIANALPVNDPDLKNPALLTGREVIRHKALHFARLEGVQVQHAVNRKLDRLIHAPELTIFPADGKWLFNDFSAWKLTEELEGDLSFPSS